MRGYDNWKTTDPSDNTLNRSNGKAERRVCLDCSWRGMGIFAQVEHWGKTGHRIVHGDDRRAKEQQR